MDLSPFPRPYQASTPEYLEIAVDALYNRTREITVLAGGTPGVDCDYDSLTDALAYAYTQENMVVRVLAGTYDMVAELGTLSGAGPVVGNGMHIIFSPQAYVTCYYTGGDPAVYNLFSPFNEGNGDFIIEGLNISAKNTRYCFHDELSGAAGFRRHEFRNCTMYLDNSEIANPSYIACIGGGLGHEVQVIIDGGHYESTVYSGIYGNTISYHNGNAAGAKSEIIIKNVYFDGTNCGIRFGYYGDSTAVTKCYVSNCSMEIAPAVMDEDGGGGAVNMELIEWNNEIRTP
jgi:hypothetical protein